MKSIVREPKQKRAIENKRVLVAAAKKLFVEKGYLNTSSNEIVKEAGLSIGTFYSYYKDKKAIFMEILEEYSIDYNEKLEKALNAMQFNDYKEHLKYIILATMEISRVYASFEEEYMIMKSADEDVRIYSHKESKYIISKIKEMLIRIKVRDCDLDIAAFLFYSLVDSFSHNIIVETDLDIAAYVDQCVKMINNYLDN